MDMDYVTITVPKELADKALEKGVDLEELIITTLIEKLGLDPSEVVRLRIELAEKSLNEAKGYIGKGDAVQASEKLYKAVEECIKALAEKYRIPEREEAYREGRWWTRLLSRAAKTLSRKLNQPIIDIAWSKAYDLHTWGFHEASLEIKHVEIDVPYIEQLLEKTKQLTKTDPRNG